MNTLTIIILLAFVLAIGFGFKTGINTGIFAMAFAFVIGTFIMGLKPSAIVSMWPLNIFFVLVFVSLFYNFPIQNGTLDKLALNMIYKFGKTAKLLPFILFITSWIMSAMGAGPYSILMLLCPIAFTISDKLKMNKLLNGVAVYFGAINGGGFPSSSTAVMTRALAGSLGYEAESMNMQIKGFLIGLVSFLIYLCILYFFVFKGHKVDTSEISFEKPEPYTSIQKRTFALIIIFICLLLFPYILGLAFPGNRFIEMLKTYMDVGFIAIILSIAAILLKIGDEKKAIAMIPWNTVIMISGVGILVGLAVEAGTIQILAKAVGTLENKTMVGAVMALIAGTMSVFSSTAGVVIPTLYPIVPALSDVTGLAAFYLFACIGTGSVATGMSPFSTCGALMLGSMPEKEVKQMYLKLIFIAAGGLALAFVELFILGLFIS